MSDASDYLNQTNIIIFGTGTIADVVSKQLDEKVLLYLDNDSQKWGKKFCNKDIYSIENLSKEKLSGAIILVASMYYKEISEQLSKIGLKEDIDYFDAKLLFIESYKGESTWSHEYHLFEEKIKALKKQPIKSLLKNYLANYKKLNFLDSRIELFVSEGKIRSFCEKELYDLYIGKINKIKKINEYNFNKAKNIHFILDNMHSKAFYDYIQKNSYADNNLFILPERNERFEFFDTIEKNIYKTSHNSMSKFCLDFQLIELINNSEEVYIHFLTDEVCELFENPLIKDVKKFWIVWGADLYSHINIPLFEEKTEGIFLNSIKKNQVINTTTGRKNFIKSLSGILTMIKGDFELVKENFETNAIHKHFLYPSFVNFSILDNILMEVERPREKINVLVGNSGTKTNNHIEVFEKLVDHLDEINEVFVPLSYGDKTYIKLVSMWGEKLLGAKFHPLYDFLDSYSYGKIINSSDLILMNHKRQQGVGNIIVSLYLGKTVYFSKSVTTYNTFKDWGFNIKSIENFFYYKERNLQDFIENNYEIRRANQKICAKYFIEIDSIYSDLFK